MKKLIALFAVLSLILCGCTERLEEFPEDYPEHLTLSDLSEYNDGITPELIVDDWSKNINGSISKYKVSDSDSAFKAIVGVADILGISDPAADLVLEHEAESAYTYVQIYKGAEVYGGTVTLYVDKKSGRTERISSYYEDDLDVDTEPLITADQAKEIADRELNFSSSTEPQLLIFNGKLVWYMYISGQQVMISAVDGRVANNVSVTIE